MKRLLIAFCCLTMGAAAFAADASTAKPTDKTVEVSLDVKDIKAGKKVTRRVQYCYEIWDQCGNTWNVWVSGPSGSTRASLYKHALYYILANSGC